MRKGRQCLKHQIKMFTVKKKKKKSIANIVKSYLVVLLNCTQIYYLTVCELRIYI